MIVRPRETTGKTTPRDTLKKHYKTNEDEILKPV